MKQESKRKIMPIQVGAALNLLRRWCVLVGTYRTDNLHWIVQRGLYNLPLEDGITPAVYSRFNVIVLYSNDNYPVARYVEFDRVVDCEWLRSTGYKVANKPHASKYVLFRLGGRTTASAVLTNPNSDVFVCSSRYTGKIDAEFYSKPIPDCGGKSIPNIFSKLKPYFTKWRSAQAFNPVQMEFDLFPEIKPIVPISANAHGARVVSLFSGAGGLDIGFIKNGFDIVWANDFDRNACDTYRKNISDHIVCGSILDVDIEKLPACDLIIGGPPCQGFSTIGKRVSSDPKKRKAHDPRNELVITYAQIIRKVKPKFIVMENVKGILTRNGGSYIKTVLSELRDAGYNVDYKLINMADYGVPQIRERIIILGNRVGLPVRFPEPDHSETGVNGLPRWVACGTVLEDLSSMGDDPSFNHVALKHTPTNIARYKLIPEGGRLPEAALPAEIYRKNFGNTFKRLHHAKPALTMVPGNDAFPIHPTLHRSLTVREAARIQTFPDSMIFSGNRRQQGHQVGNAVPPLFSEKLARFLCAEMERSKK